MTFVLLQRMEKIGGALRVRGGLEDGTFVVLENFQPVADIVSVIGADFGGDAKIGAKESGSKFGDKLLAGATLVAETFAAQVTVKATFVFRPMNIMPITA